MQYPVGWFFRFSRIMLPLLVLGACVFAQAPSYTVHDLGAGASPFAINSSGQVAGCVTVGGQIHAFRTAPNTPIDLTTDDLGTVGGTYGCANSINTSGQVAGTSTTAAGETHGFRTAPNAKINPATDDIGSLGESPFYGFVTQANGINDAGQVVGGSTVSSGPIHAFRTAPNAAINPATDDIGGLPASPIGAYFSYGRGINAAGAVAGTFTGGHFIYPTAFAYLDGTVTQIPAFIYAPGGNHFTGVNDHGQIAGTDGTCSSFSPPCISVWQSGMVTPLAHCNCEAWGINNSLQVVGQSYDLSQPGAFLYGGGTVYDLNNLVPAGSGWFLSQARAINDRGQIVGTGTLNGESHAFRLDPVVTPPQMISRIIASIQSFHLNQGETASLNSPLNTAIGYWNAGDTQAARSQMNAFEHKVNAQSGKRLAADQANQLITAAEAVIQAMNRAR